MPKKGGKKSRQKGSAKDASHAVDSAVRSALKQARGKKEKLGYVDTLQKDLASIGLVIRNIRSDGNCLFGAISDQLHGTQDRHDEVRDLITSHMAEASEQYRWFVDEDRPWEEYLAEMQEEGTWGGNIEIQAASMALHVNIVVHQCDAQVPRMAVRNWAGADGKPPATLHLAYHGAEHYNSVRLRSDIVPGEPALQFDLDSLIASGGGDPGEVAERGAPAKAASASAKASTCPDLQRLHDSVLADLEQAAALSNLQSPAVSKLLKNTRDFPGRTRQYVAALLQRVASDESVAIECLNRIPCEVLLESSGASPPAPGAAAATEAQASRNAPAAAKLSNKQRRALKKAAKFEQAAAEVQQMPAAATASGGGGAGDNVVASVQRAIQAAAAASLQRGAGKFVAATYAQEAVDI